MKQGDAVELVGILGDDWAYIAIPQESGKLYGYIPLNTLVAVSYTHLTLPTKA